MQLTSMVFKNRTAKSTHVLLVDVSSVPSVASWYGAFYAGDIYTLTLDGKKQKLDQNGEIMA